MGILNRVARSWPASRLVVTADMLNEEIRDPMTALQAAWVSYTPTVANLSVTDINGRYNRVGKTIDVTVSFQVGGAPGSQVRIGLPVPASGVHGIGVTSPRGQAIGIRQGTAYFTGTVFLDTTTTVQIMTSGRINGWGPNEPQPWASGDFWGLSLRYEAA